MQKKWHIRDIDPQLQATLSDALNVHPIVAQLLINREIVDVKEAEDFLSADLAGLHDPFLLKDMNEAVERIQKARSHEERVLVFGDYDVDGITSSALLNNVLRQMGIDVVHHIPHRVQHGYGLKGEVCTIAAAKGARLLIAVDCGITAVDEVDALHKAGIDVIIIDHHEPGEVLPRAAAIVNPKQKDCPYPFKHLAAVGLVVKLTQALLGEISEEALDLAAVGTVADVVPLHGENRILVKSGLAGLGNTKNKGLLALLETAKIKGKKITPFHVGFILGPRINAAGRMDTAHKSLDLFLSEDEKQAYDLAKALERHNTERQKMQSGVVEEAIDLVEQQINFKDQKVIVLSKEGWHKGVLGIVAAKIMEKYYRPTVVISIDEDGIGTASARSIDGFHLHNALQSCASYLEAFGGHEGAAGLTIREENIDAFRRLINDIAHQMLEAKRLIPTIFIDCEIPLSSINLELAAVMESLEPFGEGNPAPVFCSRNLAVKGFPQILGKDTIKFWVSDEEYTISAVGFGLAKYEGILRTGAKVDLAYEITIDEWNKAPTPQLKLKDIRLSKT
ncbi:MAG: single-stranded-DNA-specific exonuclease RecJ [Omnitrophica WOR_2 bacterium RIFCSPHIGHO2_02_FULL_50_17]|nr:MAG: single-stranded-DNA-specific exonuclease RecJ [Omnitrophica WOR_2 bacterium RIFCSPHIGHO2_02_FULL_50_17]